MRKYKLKKNIKAFVYPKDYIGIVSLCTPQQLFTIKTLVNTGARINEIRHVDKLDLDDERQTILLRITKTRAKLKERRPTPRIIPVSTKFYKYFKRNVKKYNILSTNQTGIILKKYGEEVNAKDWVDFSAHTLRKTFGSWMLALNVDGFKLAAHLGHSPDMLRKYYASPDIFNYKDKDLMREVLDNLPSRLRGESGI